MIETTYRQYIINGIEYDRVTSITGLLNNLSFVSEIVLNEAASYGTEVHKLLELYNLGLEPVTPAYFDDVINPYIEWYLENVREVIGVEECVVNEKMGYAGTCDLIAVLNDDPDALCIIDFKTGIPAKSHRYQLSAYCGCYQNGNVFKRYRRLSIYLPKGRRKFRVVEFKQHRHDWYIFRLLNFLYKQVKPRSRRVKNVK